MAESTLFKIIRKTGRKPIECRCNLCKSQCKTPCLATPENIEAIIDAGHKDKIMFTYWAAGKMMGVTEDIIPMYQAILDEEKGYCTFYENGLCTLHDSGLKPTEGKLSHHSTRLDNFDPKKSLSWNVAKEWIDPNNKEIINRIKEKLAL